MKTLSTGISLKGVSGVKPIYFKALSIPDFLIGSSTFDGSGTEPVIGKASCGEVPQVIVGTISEALIIIS